MSAAFALSAVPGPRATAFTGRSLTAARPTTSNPSTARMTLQTAEKPKTKSSSSSLSFSRLEANRAAKVDAEYRGPQGFTPYAEKVNGRLAMLGFFIGLVTEAVSGKPIGEQMIIMFSPLTHAVQTIAALPSKDIFFM